MTPYLVTPPATPPVTLAHLKQDPILRVVANDEDDAIMRVQAGMVSDLDGWKGWLGRCIMPQVWAVNVEGPGPHLLPFPDASNITAQADGDDLAVVVTRNGMGTYAALSDVLPGQAATIAATYGLPATDLPAAQMLITLMVKRHYDAAVGPEYEAYTRTIQAQIARLRWRCV